MTDHISDLTSPTARDARDRLAERTDVLDRVGVLRTLPDNTHVTAAMVAEFYGVDREAVLKLVQRNRDELDDDGFRIVARREVVDILSMTPDELGMPATAPSMSLFPRRAVLRVGMLLRDSATARQVRDYLLNVERPVREETDDELIHRALTVSVARIEALTAQVAELEPKAEVADRLLDASGDLSVKDAAQALTRAGVKVGEGRLFAALDTKYGWIYRHKGDGRWRVYQSAIESGWMSVLPQSHYHPKTGVLVVDPPQPRVTPKGLQRLLSDHGAGSAVADLARLATDAPGGA